MTDGSQRQLHVFTNASNLAHGAVAYLSTQYADGEVEFAFVMAKTHVAPVKKHTIPQLELKGAIDGLELAQRITTDLDLNMADVVFHTDSETVLKWINTKNADEMDVFVSNRVGQIQRATSVEQ